MLEQTPHLQLQDDDCNIRIPWHLHARLVLLFLVACPLFVLAYSLIVANARFLVMLIPCAFISIPIGFWLGRFPGSLEAASSKSIFINPRCGNTNWLYLFSKSDDGKPPESVYLHTDEIFFSYSGGRLKLLLPHGYFDLGSGTAMLPIRDWLIRHGVQPKV
jgi:hypothetical protein